MQGKRGTRNLLGNQICVLPDSEVVRDPRVPVCYQSGRDWVTVPPESSNLALAPKLLRRGRTRKTW